MKISLIHPSRSRPELAKQVYDKWMCNADDKDNIEYLFSIDESDPKLNDYLEIMKQGVVHSNTHCLAGLNTSAIQAINNAAEHATADLLMVVSDDFDCPEHWDTLLLSYLKGKSDFVVKTYDGLQPWIMTLPIMDRGYYERFGYIYNPEYRHMFCDTEMTHVGDLLGKTIIVPITFEHKHYTQSGGITKDDVSVKNDSTWLQGEKLYLERINTNFGLADEDIKGVLRCDKGHLNWLKSKGVNIEVV